MTWREFCALVTAAEMRGIEEAQYLAPLPEESLVKDGREAAPGELSLVSLATWLPRLATLRVSDA